MSAEEYTQTQRQIASAAERVLLGEAQPAPVPTRCVRCGTAVAPQTLEGQIAEFVDFQRRHGTGYIWPEAEMAKLAARLEPGDVLEPYYAYSIRIRKADGLVILHERKS